MTECKLISRKSLSLFLVQEECHIEAFKTPQRQSKCPKCNGYVETHKFNVHLRTCRVKNHLED